MRLLRHPLVGRDIDGIFEHVLASTQGDLDAAERRLDEIDALLAGIVANPASGVRLSGALVGWLVRHGGRDRKIAVVFKTDLDRDLLFIALVAFGGQDWLAGAAQRRDVL